MQMNVQIGDVVFFAVLEKNEAERTGLYLSEGRQYGESESSFIGVNIVCPRRRLETVYRNYMALISSMRKVIKIEEGI